MDKYLLFVKRYNKPLKVLLVIMNILAIIGLFQINISSDFKIFVPTNSENQKFLEEMDTTFPSSDQIIYMIPLKDNLTFESFTKLQTLQYFFTEMDHVNRLRGPAPAEVSIGPNTLIIDEKDPTSLAKLSAYYDLLGDLSPIVQKDDATYALFTLFITEDFTTSDIHNIEDELETLGFEHYATGDNYMQLLIFDYISKILMFIPPIALFFVLLVFSFQLKSIKATLLSILPAGLGSLWTLGIIGWIGNEVSIITVLAPIFTIVIGSADGLHFVSHVQDEESLGNDNLTSLSKTLSIVGKPMIITTVTSIVGFLALLTMNTSAIKDLAIYASLGIFLAGFITWYVLPLILIGNMKLHKPSKNKPLTFNFLKKLWGIPSYIIVFLCLIFFAIGLPNVKTEFNMLMVYKESTSIYKNTIKIQEINGGSIPIYLFGSTEDDPLDPLYANKFIELSNILLDSGYASKILSPYSIIETLIPIIIPGSEGYPSNPQILKQLSGQILQSDESPVKDMLNFESNNVKLIVFPKDLENSTLSEIRNLVVNYNEGLASANIPMSITTTGVQYMMMDLNNSMFNNQIMSTGLALVIVFILLLISFRKFLPSLISLIPIVVTTLFLFGFLAFTGISLNILTTTMFSITIGVGIDYAIHYTSVFIHLKNEGDSSSEAAIKAYSYSAKPIIANALGLSLGLSALLLSPLQIHTNVSLLMWTTMTISVLFSLTFLPTALKRFVK